MALSQLVSSQASGYKPRARFIQCCTCPASMLAARRQWIHNAAQIYLSFASCIGSQKCLYRVTESTSAFVVLPFDVTSVVVGQPSSSTSVQKMSLSLATARCIHDLSSFQTREMVDSQVLLFTIEVSKFAHKPPPLSILQP